MRTQPLEINEYLAQGYSSDHAGQAMKDGGEMEDLFLVCDPCKKYVFAHEVRS